MGRSTTEEVESERAAQRSRPQITKVKARCLCGCEEPQPARLQAERGQSSRQRTRSLEGNGSGDVGAARDVAGISQHPHRFNPHLLLH